MSVWDDVEREAVHDYYDERPEPERPSAAELVGADPGIEVGGTTHSPKPWSKDCPACNRANGGFGEPALRCAFCGMAL